jgi:hypothetical protein
MGTGRFDLDLYRKTSDTFSATFQQCGFDLVFERAFVAIPLQVRVARYVLVLRRLSTLAIVSDNLGK